jgi:hypothetical protein
MKISQDVDGLKFIGECTPEAGFVAGDVECARCGRRIDAVVQPQDVSLCCSGCGIKWKAFWSEADLHVYLSENWRRLREACTHPTVTLHGSS